MRMLWPLGIIVLLSALNGALAAQAERGADCKFEYRGGVACTVDWGSGNQRKTACDLITEAVAEKAFDGPAAKPVHINVLLSGWVHSSSFDVCEFNSLAQAGATKSTITLYVYYPPFERGDWPAYFRGFLTAVRDVEWPNAVAYWTNNTASEDQPNLYVFDNKAHIFIGAKGFADEQLALEKTKMIASAALLTISH